MPRNFCALPKVVEDHDEITAQSVDWDAYAAEVPATDTSATWTDFGMDLALAENEAVTTIAKGAALRAYEEGAVLVLEEVDFSV